MKTTNSIVDIEGVTHLEKDLYRVRLSLIQFADQTDENVFYNPRHSLDFEGKSVARGFSKEEMNELKSAIQNSGLNNPILVRPVENNGKITLQLVDGERRKRCLDSLVKANTLCFSPSEDKEVPAKELYEYVDCRIRTMDDKIAFRQAFSTNNTSIDIGECALISFVRTLRARDADDEYIREITNKSSSWLRETDRLISLDKVTFQALACEDINRSAALKLAEIEDIQERMDVLAKLKSAAHARITKVKEKHDLEIAKAEEDEERAVAALAATKALGGNVNSAQECLDEAREKVEKRRRNRARVDNKKVTITSKDIDTVSDENKPLTNAKIDKYWRQPILQVLKDNNDETIDIADCRLVLELLDKKNVGEKDILSILRDHASNKITV